MLELDTSQLPPRVLTTLMQRGAQLPPLQWHTNPNRAAKATLDQSADDGELLGIRPVRPEMAAAVRALLYLWNGWPDEALKHAGAAPQPEQAWITAMCRRQAGEVAAAKIHLQQIGQHPVYPALATYAIQAIGLSPTPALRRLREVISFGEQWEPHAFADVYEQARVGALDPAAEQIVRSIQGREFELLLVHCLEAAMGGKLKRADSTAATQGRPPTRPRPRRSAEPASRPMPANRPILRPIPLSEDVTVLCPSCGQTLSFPQHARGSPAKCSKCGTCFLVPPRPPGKPGSTTPASTKAAVGSKAPAAGKPTARTLGK